MIGQDVAVALPPATLNALQIGVTAAESDGGAERYYFNLLRALRGTAA